MKLPARFLIIVSLALVAAFGSGCGHDIPMPSDEGLQGTGPGSGGSGSGTGTGSGSGTGTGTGTGSLSPPVLNVSALPPLSNDAIAYLEYLFESILPLAEAPVAAFPTGAPIPQDGIQGAIYLSGIPFSTLSPFVNGACAGNWDFTHALVCASAASRLCRAVGAAGGVIAEYDVGGQRADVVCVIHGDASTRTLSGDLDAWLAPGACDGAWDAAKTLVCNSGAARDAQYRGLPGGTLQEFDSSHDRAVTLAPMRGRSLGVPLATLAAEIGDVPVGDWDGNVDSLIFNSAASRWCRSTQQAIGGFIEEYDSRVNQAATVLCLY